MAASVTYGTTLLNADGTPKAAYFQRTPMGLGGNACVETIPTTMQDDIGDFMGLIPVPAGKRLLWGSLASTDMDTGTAALDADLVLRTIDKLGNITDTILFDSSVAAATYFGTAQVPRVFIIGTAGVPVVVPSDADDVALVGWKVNTAAATPASGTLSVGLVWV